MYTYISTIKKHIYQNYIYICIIYNTTYLRINIGYTFKFYCTHPSRICVQQIRDLTGAQGPIRGPDRRKQQRCTYTPAWMSDRKLGSMGLFQLLIHGVFVGGFSPIDPNH